MGKIKITSYIVHNLESRKSNVKTSNYYVLLYNLGNHTHLKEEEDNCFFMYEAKSKLGNTKLLGQKVEALNAGSANPFSHMVCRDMSCSRTELLIS